MKKSISREILVPNDMRLHNLHYMIQAAFGWYANQFYTFTYPEYIFAFIGRNNLLEWSRLSGLYFYFSGSVGTSDDERCFWNNDFIQGTDFDSWLKSKYVGPYKNLDESFFCEQMDVREFVKSNEEVEVGPGYRDLIKHNYEVRETVKIQDVDIFQMEGYFGGALNMLMDKLKIGDVIINQFLLKNCMTLFHNYVSSMNMTANKMMKTLDDIEKEHFALSKLEYELNEYLKKNGKNFDYIEEITGKIEKQRKKYKCLIRYMQRHEPTRVIPISDTIKYLYDYGDEWKVEIKCIDSYNIFFGNKAFSNEGKAISDEIAERAVRASKEHRPICIARDGLNLIPDVGTIDNYCTILKDLYEGNEQERRDTREWLEESFDWKDEIPEPFDML